jgi:glyoxylase-like metal-dependent hydrolase (beta-lactamase superfamily II)
MNDHDPILARSDGPQVPTGPLAVRPQCWMVGRRNPESLLQCNTYMRTFGGGSSAVNICVDPGSRLDYPTIEANVGQLIGDIGNLQSFSLNHQDPDVLGNAEFLMAANPHISVMVTEDVWRLAQHLLPRPQRVHFVNAAHAPAAIVGDRYGWQLVPTPFCHFRGAMAFYDPELRTLFSGDLFGGLNRLGRVQLVAEEGDWTGIAQFHQIYMPGREALRYAVRQIRALDPPVEVIAPQHGFVITGDLVPLFLERMHELLVGHDLLAVELDETYLEGYRDVILQMISRAAEAMGRDEVFSRLRDTRVPDGLHGLLHFEGDDLCLDREGYSAVVKVLARLARRESMELLNALRSEALGVCSERGLPIPPIGAGVEDAVQPDSVGPDGIRTQAWWLK